MIFLSPKDHIIIRHKVHNLTSVPMKISSSTLNLTCDIKKKNYRDNFMSALCKKPLLENMKGQNESVEILGKKHTIRNFVTK